jgi:hypothetical protein
MPRLLLRCARARCQCRQEIGPHERLGLGVSQGPKMAGVLQIADDWSRCPRRQPWATSCRERAQQLLKLAV